MALKKSEMISVRVEKKTKDQLIKLATEQRRELHDYVRLILTDVADKKIKISL